MEYFQIHLHLGGFMVNVGKYNTYMDGMGLTSHEIVHRETIDSISLRPITSPTHSRSIDTKLQGHW